MIYKLGPQSLRVYEALRHEIVSGELTPGTRLPSLPALAAAFRVATLTVRHALGQLEAEGLVSRQRGRGTFVAAGAAPAVLIVDDEASVRALLGAHAGRAGYRVVAAEGPAAGLAALEADPAIALVLSDIRMPTTEAGVEFIRAVRRRWPQLPLAAVTGYPQDLAGLHGSPECPLLIVPKPFRAHQIEEVLRLGLRRDAGDRTRET